LRRLWPPAYDFESDQTPARTHCIDLNRQTWITLRRLSLVGGSNAALDDWAAATGAAEGVVVEECGIFNIDASGVRIRFDATADITTQGFRLLRSVVNGQNAVYLGLYENDVAEAKLDVVIQNCLLFGRGYLGNGVYINRELDATYPIGANVFLNCYYAIYKYLGSGTVDEDDSRLVNTASTSVSGTFTKADVAPWLGGFIDHPMRCAGGWSPWEPWEPIITYNDDRDDLVDNVVMADTTVPQDLYGRPRFGRTTHDIGAVEGHVSATRDDSVYKTAAPSIAFKYGAGYHDFFVPVDAVSTTISVWARYNSDYVGDLPRMRVMNIPGVADQEVVMTAGANTWEQLSVTFTPSQAGVVRVRLESRNYSTTGIAYFDDLTVA